MEDFFMQKTFRDNSIFSGYINNLVIKYSYCNIWMQVVPVSTGIKKKHIKKKVNYCFCLSRAYSLLDLNKIVRWVRIYHMTMRWIIREEDSRLAAFKFFDQMTMLLDEAFAFIYKAVSEVVTRQL